MADRRQAEGVARRDRAHRRAEGGGEGQGDQALSDLKAGKPWADVAKTLPDDLYSSQGGEAGWMTKDASVIDKKVLDAMFTLPVNGLTDVIEGTTAYTGSGA